MPRGSPAKAWPLQPLISVGGRKRTPLDVLREILDLAEQGAPDAHGLKQLAFACISNAHDPAVADAEHVESVRQALEAARQGRWVLAGQLLQHPGKARTEEVPMAWPNYNIPVPASLILNEIIYRASVAQPDNLSGIITAAINCSVNMHAHHPALQHTEAAGGNAGTLALDQRIVNALKRASTASSPADWIYVENELNHD